MTDHLQDFLYSQSIVNVMPPRDERGVVWHYTDARGALGIIESGSLWATSAAMLNDTDEFRHGLHLIATLWQQVSNDYVQANIVEGWLADARSKLEYFHLADSYVVCASLVGDSFSQFRTYGNYAIGLSTHTPLEKELAFASETRSGGMSSTFELGWRRVLYDDEEKQAHCLKLFYELSELARIEAVAHSDDVYLAALECVFRSVTYMKSSEFEQEQEVRLCGQGTRAGAKVFFRVNDYGIAPYIHVRTSREFANDRLPLTHINLGPRVQFPDSAETGLRVALREKGFDLGEPITRIMGSGR